MKSAVAQLVEQAISALPDYADAPEISSISTTVERTRDARHGDFTTNVAMRLAKSAGRNPREIAGHIIDRLPDSDMVDAVEIAGPGFINFRLSDNAFHQEICTILEQADQYGRQDRRKSPKILLEFVSANPTGPLHVGHGRHAAFGATLGNLLEAAGFDVDREYYVNDAGRQMDILGVSVLLRILELGGATIEFPEAGYKGDYIVAIAKSLGDQPDIDAIAFTANLPDDDKEAVIGALIDRAEDMMGGESFRKLRRQSLDSILQDIKEDRADAQGT